MRLHELGYMAALVQMFAATSKLLLFPFPPPRFLSLVLLFPRSDLRLALEFHPVCPFSVFWVSTITGLPGVIPGFTEGEGSLAIV